MILCGGSDSGELKYPENDFRYLYWTISKILSWNLFTYKGTYMNTGLNLSHGAKFQRFLMAKVFVWTQNFKSENFMHIELSEEKFLKGSVGHQIKLLFWNKLQMTDLLPMQLASYRYMLTYIYIYIYIYLWKLNINFMSWQIWFIS